MTEPGKNVRKNGPRDKKFLRVVLAFFFLAFVLNLGIRYLAQSNSLRPFNIFNAQVITGLMDVSGLQAMREHNVIYLAHRVWVVNSECTAINLMAIFCSFVLVYPASLKSRAISLITGIPFIFGANMVRLYLMAWVDKLKPEFSEFFHDYMWQGVFIVMIVLMWLVWIDQVVNRETKAPLSR